jgi:hypothetical protein
MEVGSTVSKVIDGIVQLVDPILKEIEREELFPGKDVSASLIGMPRPGALTFAIFVDSKFHDTLTISCELLKNLADGTFKSDAKFAFDSEISQWQTYR